MVKLTVVGSLNYDLVTFTSRVPEAGETIKANNFESHTGGKGFNEALALGRLLPQEVKGKTHFVQLIGKVGDDSFGPILVNALEKESVDVSRIETVKDTATGVATILVEESGENRILITGGANDKFTPGDTELQKYFPANESSLEHYIMLQNEFPVYEEVILWLKQNRPGFQIAYNPSPMKKVTSDYFKCVDLLIVNEVESKQILEYLTGSSSVQEPTTKEAKIDFFGNIAKSLLSKINNAENSLNLVIVTLGSLGVIYTSAKTQGKTEFLPSQKVEKVVDTTGAGDTFFGSVVSQLSLGKSYKDAITFATVASSLAIQKKGAGGSIPKFTDVQKRLSN